MTNSILNQRSNNPGAPASRTPPARPRAPNTPAALFVVLCFFALTTTQAEAQLFEYFWPKDSLQAVVKDVEKRYPDVSNITTNELAQRIEKTSDDIILIDVREPDEYNVSRISGAIRTSPNASASDIAASLPTVLKNKSVVFYCSVGERSSRMARRAKSRLMSSGAKSVYNLGGGIFAWHNEQKKLVNASGETPYVHPFDSHWGRYVTHSNLTRLKPSLN